jgi:hypothetical protein
MPGPKPTVSQRSIKKGAENEIQDYTKNQDAVHNKVDANVRFVLFIKFFKHFKHFPSVKLNQIALILPSKVTI